MRRIFFFGAPKEVGGANTEAWHTLRLFRSHGLPVACVPTWTLPSSQWCERLRGIGCDLVEATPETIGEIPHLAGSTVLASCNHRFLEQAPKIRELGCRIVWQNCMTWVFPPMVLDHQANGCFDRYVFHSQYQQDQLIPQLRKWGYQENQGTVIHGAFEASDFQFSPRDHLQDETFVVGRISRAGVDKYPADLWRQYLRIPHPRGAMVMGWSYEVEDKLGPPPVWAQTLPTGHKSTADFLPGIHVLAPGIGACAENWPRVGLEAMAAGVVVVAEDRGGWREMILDGKTGFLCRNADHAAYRIACLAYDDGLRREMAAKARWHLEHELADPERIWAGWKRIFEELAE